MGSFCFPLLICLALLTAGPSGAARSVPGRVASKPPPAIPRTEALRFQPGRACKLTSQVVHVYSFALKKGDFEELVFDQQGADISVEVFDPQHHKLVTVDGMSSSMGTEDVPWVADSSGNYQVKVSADHGTYVSRTAVHRRATPQDRDRAAAAVAYSEGRELKVQKKNKEAETRFREAARLAGKVKDRLREADAWNQLGVLQNDEHRWTDCQDSFARALSIYDDLEQRVQLPRMLIPMAEALKNLGESDRAAAALERGIRLAHEFNNVDIEASSRLNLGGLELETGKIDQALTDLLEAARLYHQKSDPKNEARALISAGRAYSKMGQIEQALTVERKALETLRPAEDEILIASTYSQFGDTYREASLFEKAVSYYRRALNIFRHEKALDSEAATSNQLGLALSHLKKYREAEAAFQRALKIFQESHRAADEATAWINLGFIDLQVGAVPKAIESLQQALTINRRQKRLNLEASAYYQLAWAERRRNSPAAARAYAAHALDALESLRTANQKGEVRALVGARWQQLYELQVELLMEQHRLERTAGHDIEAFDVGERARARTLLESLGERSSPPPLGLRQVQQQVLDQDTVLLEYSFGKERSYLWAVTPQEYSSFELPAWAKIEPLVRAVNKLLPLSHRKQDQQEAVRQARALSQILLGPVARRLGNKRLLIVVPSELQSVPFAALPDLSDEGPPETDGRWPLPLVVHHEIVNAPSASVIAALRDQRADRPEPKNLLALVAAPIYELNGKRRSASRFKPLPSSRSEAEAIARLAAGETVLKLYDFEANRDRVMDLLGDYRILHFSVHGDPNTSHTDLSALVLSAFDREGKPIDPYLRARDIQDLDLPADLAVLSACGTGLGREVRGEGLMGLTQAFLSAGTSSVVVSLWNVDDTSTKRLMSHFYSQLLKRGLRPAAALREAQVRMWLHQRWNAPSYWAAFIEQGEWK
jgi:CHAT domain-containing protein